MGAAVMMLVGKKKKGGGCGYSNPLVATRSSVRNRLHAVLKLHRLPTRELTLASPANTNPLPRPRQGQLVPGKRPRVRGSLPPGLDQGLFRASSKSARTFLRW